MRVVQPAAPQADPRFTIAVIKGEDAAPEAVDATLELLEALDAPLDFTFPIVGSEGERIYGSTFAPAAQAVIDDSDATLFGATSGPSGIALFYLRFGKATFANVRPARMIPGARSPLADPAGIDFVVVRENLEGLYSGIEGPLSDLAAMQFHHPLGGRLADRDGMFSLKVVTADASERVARFAFELARHRATRRKPQPRVTLGAKHNILSADQLFADAASRVSDDYPDVDFDENFIDNLARRMVAEPQALDVVVVPNFAGDITSDVAAGVIGGLGLMPSGCYGHDYAYFEPPHGTAPDLTGLGVINPTAQMLSASMLLDHLGLTDLATRVRHGIDTVFAGGRTLPRDQGGTASTTEFTTAVIAATQDT